MRSCIVSLSGLRGDHKRGISRLEQLLYFRAAKTYILTTGKRAPVRFLGGGNVRPENKKMKAFLKANEINAVPKYLYEGSLAGCWRLQNLKQRVICGCFNLCQRTGTNWIYIHNIKNLSTEKEVIMHSKTPWKVETSLYGKFVFSPSNPVCQIHGGHNNGADAEFIVKACNAYDELLLACKDTLDIILAYQHIPAQKKAYMILQNMIKKAEGKS